MKIINANSDLGLHIDGTEKGPRLLNQDINAINIDKPFCIKNKKPNQSLRNLKQLNEFNEKLYNEIIKHNDFVLTIGGDHSIAIASALASIKKINNLGIIWVDAHSDFHTSESSISGNIHGMPLCTIVGKNKDGLSFFHNENYYNPQNTVIVGARDIETPELDNLKEAGVKFFSTAGIKKYGYKSIIKNALEIASKNTNGVHISFDLDVIDPIDCPGVSVPVKNGISKTDAINIVYELLKENIVSFDLVEFNPLLDKDNKTYDIAKEIIDIIKKKNE